MTSIANRNSSRKKKMALIRTSMVSTPLQRLEAMNQELLAKRKKPAPPLKTPDAVESWYRRQLRSLVVAMNKAIGAEILPIIRQEREAYVGDAMPTFDGWAERINRAL